ncbi:type II secretion system protein [Neptunomonas sp.]|uniref:type II secretion system protein n=1 Tax=Neptunomonas sp. TaxID=1971898 RepID=UPI0025DD3C5F|nr:prepilin-type N-terminal cleavage/methylation domain-containing protein [Neptunomonas sp.]
MRQRGFTIIELVTVIALLGIMSAVALPRFIDITGDAEEAVSSSTLGSFSTSLSLARSAWFAKGANQTSISMDGVTYEYSAQGWPTGSTLDSSGCSELWRDLMQSAPSIGEFGTVTLGDTEWISFGNTSLCLFLQPKGTAINAAVDPYMLYYFTNAGTVSAGTVTTFNFL